MTSLTLLLATDVPIAVVTGLAFVAAAVGVIVSIRAGLTANAANEIAERANTAAERSLVLSVRPVLVGDSDSDEPFRYTPDDAPTTTKYRSGTGNNPAMRVSFPVRNMGAGPALVCSAAVRATGGAVLVGGTVSGLWIYLSKLVVCQGESCQF